MTEEFIEVLEILKEIRADIEEGKMLCNSPQSQKRLAAMAGYDQRAPRVALCLGWCPVRIHCTEISEEPLFLM